MSNIVKWKDATGISAELRDLETAVVMGFRRTNEAVTSAGVALFEICDRKLYLEYKDEHGNIFFPDQETYLSWLADEGRFSRQSAFNALRDVGLWVYGLKGDPEEMILFGGVWGVRNLHRIVEYNGRTRKIVGFRKTPEAAKLMPLLPTGIDEGAQLTQWLRNKLDVIRQNADTPEELRLAPKDIAGYISVIGQQNQFAFDLEETLPTVTPTTMVQCIQDALDQAPANAAAWLHGWLKEYLAGRQALQVKYFVEYHDGRMASGYLDEGDTPPEVVAEIRKLLRVSEK